MINVITMRKTPASATVVENAVHKRRKVTATHKRHESGQSLVLKPEHAVARDGKRMYVQEVMAPAAPANALNQTSQFSFIVENDAVSLVKDCVLRFSIEVDDEAQLMPTPLWFDRIEWYDRHSGREIARYHGDVMLWLLMTLGQDALDLLAEPVNYDSCSLKVQE